MADGSDNPILDMGLLGMMQPNPYIDPAYAGKPLQLPGFRGVATNAMGQPIGTPPPAQGTTLNSVPAQAGAAPSAPAGGTINYGAMGSAGAPLQELMNNYQAAQGKLTPQQQYDQQQTKTMNASNLQQLNGQRAAQAAGGGFGNMGGGAFNGGQAISPTSLAMMTGGGGGAPAAPSSPAPTGVDSRQAYLDALANPGNPPIVGAAVPASKPLGTPSVLNAFMAAHPSGGVKGAGGYDNSGFFNTLSNLRSA